MFELYLISIKLKQFTAKNFQKIENKKKNKK